MSKSRIIKDLEWVGVTPSIPIAISRAWAVGNPTVPSSGDLNRMLIVYVVTESQSAGAETVVDIQINGISGTLIGNQIQVNDLYSNLISIFRWNNSQLASMPTSPSVSITWSSGGSTFGEEEILSAIYANVNQSNPVVDIRTGADTNNPANYTDIITTESDGVVLAGYVSGNGFSSPSSGEPGYVNQVYYNGPSASGAVFAKFTAGASETIDLDITNTNRNAYNCVSLRKQ